MAESEVFLGLVLSVIEVSLRTVEIVVELPEILFGWGFGKENIGALNQLGL